MSNRECHSFAWEAYIYDIWMEDLRSRNNPRTLPNVVREKLHSEAEERVEAEKHSKYTLQVFKS